VPLHADADESEPTLLRPTRAAAPAEDTARRRLPRWAIALAATIAVIAGLAAGYLVVREPTKAAPPPQTVPARVADSAYAATVSATFANLRKREAPLQRSLNRAGTAAGQANALHRIAAAYSNAAGVISAAQPQAKARAANAAVSGALDDVANAYASLSTAAGEHKRKTYNRRRAAVDQAKQKLATAVNKLEQAGYSVR
jgi:hypothetical protein